MSRVAKTPIVIPEGVEVMLNGQTVTVKSSRGELSHFVNEAVSVSVDNGSIVFSPFKNTTKANAHAGTARALVNNMVVGVTKRFVKKLNLQGVGYRAALKNDVINLTLGFSHPVEHKVPEGITVECPSQTEIVLTSCDKQLLGQVAADIRSYRKPEPYKGKGIRYADEIVRTKEAKKK